MDKYSYGKCIEGETVVYLLSNADKKTNRVIRGVLSSYINYLHEFEQLRSSQEWAVNALREEKVQYLYSNVPDPYYSNKNMVEKTIELLNWYQKQIIK